MCKAVDNYPHVLEFAPECYKTQKMWDKAVYTYSSITNFFPECRINQEICHKAVK